MTADDAGARSLDKVLLIPGEIQQKQREQQQQEQHEWTVVH